MELRQPASHAHVPATSRRPAQSGSLAAAPALGHAPAGVNLAAEIRQLVASGSGDEARERFGDLVEAHQRRAVRIAFHLLRDADEADEAVQDAFLKVFIHIGAYDDRWPFEAWFTRILVNTCRDRRKTRARRLQWVLPEPALPIRPFEAPSRDPNAEDRLLSRERWQRLSEAVDQLPGRQRTVFVLCQYGEHSAGQVGSMIGLSEATVRVHLFRAIRKLRHLLGEWRERR